MFTFFQKELKPKDPMEERKLQNLKNQAAQWQQNLQMQQQWGPPGAPSNNHIYF